MLCLKKPPSLLKNACIVDFGSICAFIHIQNLKDIFISVRLLEVFQLPTLFIRSQPMMILTDKRAYILSEWDIDYLDGFLENK